MADGGVSGLLISAAIQIAISVALQALFRPPDQTIEGPGLDNSPFTRAAHGNPVAMLFGTDRTAGVVIDIPDPPLEEVITEHETGGKGFLSPTITTRNKEYFLTVDLAFGSEGVQALIQLIVDRGKIVVDNDGSVSLQQLISSGGVSTTAGLVGLGSVNGSHEIILYPGGPTQMPDPEEVARRGEEIPAYRHLSRLKINRLPVANYGNHVPSFEAVLTTNALQSAPFIKMDPEPDDGPDFNDALSRLTIDPFKSVVYGKTAGGRIWSADLGTLDFRLHIGNSQLNIIAPAAGLDGFVYTQTGGSNAKPLRKIDAETGVQVGLLGAQGIILSDQGPETGIINYGGAGSWHQLQYPTQGNPFFGQGVQSIPLLNVPILAAPYVSMLLHMNLFGTANGSLTLIHNINIALGTGGSGLEYIHTLSEADGFETMDGTAIPDHDRGVFYTLTSADAGATTQIIRIQFTSIMGDADGAEGFSSFPSFLEVKRLSRTAGGEFASGGNIAGWAVNRGNGQLILSNGTDVVLYDPDADIVLAERHDLPGLVSTGNYFSTDKFAFVNGGGDIVVIDTRTLATTRVLTAASIGLGGLSARASAWDDLTRAVVVMRPGGSQDNRFYKIFVDKVSGQGVDLDFVVTKLSTSYRRIPTANLEEDQIDVTELAGDTVQGFTVNNRSTSKNALQHLRALYFFDAVGSDWIVKFPKRDRPSLLTVPEQDIGSLAKGEERSPFRETIVNEGELPMRISMRYKNLDAGFSIDVEHDKRQRRPVPTMSADNERSIDLALVSTGTPMKRAASRHLFDTWSRRRQFATDLPWRYIELDPTDVFRMVKSGETLEVKMSKLDVGANLTMSFEAELVDANNSDSSVTSGDRLGYVRHFVPAALPTRTVFLDAPTLTLADMKFAPISNAYVALGAFQNGWPGAGLYRSPTNANFQQVASVNVEMALAKVRAAPGPWDGFTNRFQEVVEGGSLSVVPLRRVTAWENATEEQVLNGGNLLAAVTSAGVEVLQFQDAVYEDDGTITLQRLLRGRFGTEDVVDTGGLAPGDVVVMLSDPSGTKETGPISRTNLEVPQLGQTLYYRAATFGSILEDAQTLPYIFTGRDLLPLAPTGVGIEFLAQGGRLVDAGGFLNFTRRYRGPEAVYVVPPLNETIEEYDVVVTRDSDGLVVLEETVDEQDAFLPLADIAPAIYSDGTNILVNGDGEDGVLTPWTSVSGSGKYGGWSVAQIPYADLTVTDPAFPAGSAWVVRMHNSNPLTNTHGVAYQEVDLSGVIADFMPVDQGKASVLFSASVARPSMGVNDDSSCKLLLQYLDGSDNVIPLQEGLVDNDPDIGGDYRTMEFWHSPKAANAWKRIHLHDVMPSGTRKIRFLLRSQRNSGGAGTALNENDDVTLSNSGDAFMAFDNMQGLIQSGEETFTIEVFQKSAVIGRGLPGLGVFPEES